MRRAVVINALLNYEDWTSLSGKQDFIGELLNKAKKLVKREDIYIIVNSAVLKKLGKRLSEFKMIAVEDQRTAAVFDQVCSTIRNYEDMVYLCMDTPLIDVDIAKHMMALHRDEIAEYTYGEGFPLGYVPEIVKVSLLPKLVSLLEKDDSQIARDSLFSTLSKEINSFDIETYFAPQDLKLRRLELALSPKKNRLITQRIIEKEGSGCSYERFCEIINEQPAIIRSVPAFIEVEITNKTDGSCIYSPVSLLKRPIGELGFENYKTIFNKIMDFAEEFYISFSYIGEPLLHDNLKKLIEYTIERPKVRLILETDGFFFTPDFSDYISGLKAENLFFIFDVDAVEEETYKKVRGKDLRRVERNIRYLISKWNRNVYIQMVRMDNNEQEMLKFYDQWEGEGAKVIIQKFNSYLNLLPTLSQADMKPLDRQPCWHLMRDLVIFNNGDVPRCKQDINAELYLGNLLNDNVDDIWKKNEKYYLQHCQGEYDRWCKICDEYYTYNF